ncbi:hypothetical protein FA95DRAFT_95365 [Auriscalpium vulgare]|uniref:Uncharacterized protein n=1 Tax=Auriscalpium vulgare TaxID=40419 RepID=A0ACB8RPZ6_9AGAM|nr:hypothetical protein FA95DRAFT_95365 [Auriscalpium vulgare]
MVQLSTLLLTLVVSGTALAAPSRLYTKRISDSTTTGWDLASSSTTASWDLACDDAAFAVNESVDHVRDQCIPITSNMSTTLLATAGPCDQQDVADAMVDIARKLNNDAGMILVAQIFAQQPRNTSDSLSVPYCQVAPKNAELVGLYQCQFQGANLTQFAGGVTVGAVGTMPLGMTSPLTPAGSCPAHPAGPILNGTELINQVSGPGVGQPGVGITSSASTATSTTSSAAFASSSSGTNSGISSTSTPAATSLLATSTTSVSSTSIPNSNVFRVSRRLWFFPPFDLAASPSAAV